MEQLPCACLQTYGLFRQKYSLRSAGSGYSNVSPLLAGAVGLQWCFGFPYEVALLTVAAFRFVDFWIRIV